MIAVVAPVMGQKTAYCGATGIARFVKLRACTMIAGVAAQSRRRAAAITDHVSNSLCRSACSAGGPVSFSGGSFGGNPADIGYHGKTAIELTGNTVDFGGVPQILTKGRKPCRKNPSSSRPSQPSLCPLVSKATPNVPLQALAQVWLQLKCLAPTAPALFWQVPPQACSVTTSASAVLHVADAAALRRDTILVGRRRGMTPAAVSRFGGDL